MLQSHHPTIEELKTLPLFYGLDEKALGAIQSGLYIKTFPKKKLLYVQGTSIDYCYVILDGIVKIFLESANGAEAMLAIASQGEVLGDTAIHANARYLTSAQAVEKVQVVSIPVTVFHHLVEGNRTIAANLLESFSSVMTKLFKQIQQNTALTAPQRLGCFLLDLYQRQSNCNDCKITLPYAKQLIAAQLQMTPETLSRAMCELKSHGLRMERSDIYIENLPELQAFSQGR